MQVEEKKHSDYEQGAMFGSFKKEITIFFKNIDNIGKDIGTIQKNHHTQQQTPQHRMRVLKVRPLISLYFRC